LSTPVIATTTCADFRCAQDRFVSCTYRPRLLPGATGWLARSHQRRCADGSLLFHARLCARSAPLTPDGSSGLHNQDLHPFHGLRPIGRGSAPSPVRRKTAGSVTTLQDSLQATDHALARPPRGLCRGASTLRISPRAGHQLHGCLVTTVAGPPPASRTQLPGRTPIPDLVEIVCKVGLERLQILSVHSRGTLVGRDPPIRLPDQLLGNRKRLAVRLWHVLLASSRD
jgi:hypothetical protein